jgi:hypothetical protein
MMRFDEYGMYDDAETMGLLGLPTPQAAPIAAPVAAPAPQGIQITDPARWNWWDAKRGQQVGIAGSLFDQMASLGYSPQDVTQIRDPQQLAAIAGMSQEEVAQLAAQLERDNGKSWMNGNPDDILADALRSRAHNAQAQNWLNQNGYNIGTTDQGGVQTQVLTNAQGQEMGRDAFDWQSFVNSENKAVTNTALTMAALMGGAAYFGGPAAGASGGGGGAGLGAASGGGGSAATGLVGGSAPVLTSGGTIASVTPGLSMATGSMLPTLQTIGAAGAAGGVSAGLAGSSAPSLSAAGAGGGSIASATPGLSMAGTAPVASVPNAFGAAGAMGAVGGAGGGAGAAGAATEGSYLDLLKSSEMGGIGSGAASGSVMDMVKAGGSGLLSGTGGGSNLASIVGGIAGAAEGGKPTTATTQNQIDPRMAQYLYGTGYGDKNSFLGAAQDWWKNNQSGMNANMQQGLDTLRNLYTSPQYTQGYSQMRDVGQGLLGRPIAGNPFTQGGGGLLGPSMQQPMQLSMQDPMQAPGPNVGVPRFNMPRSI